MNTSPESIEKAVDFFATLPTIGRKTARRLVYHLLRQDDGFVRLFTDAIANMRDSVKECSVCRTFTDGQLCAVCAGERVHSSQICVVEQASDVHTIEKLGTFRGAYHVLHGVMNPIDGIGPDDLRIGDLISRINESVVEVIIAVSPTVEGEVTTQYIARLLRPLNVLVTRPARGLATGSSLEFADEASLLRALESRIPVDEPSERMR